MLKLSSNSLIPLGPVTEGGASVRRLTDNPNYIQPLRASEYFLARQVDQDLPTGFAGYLVFDSARSGAPANTFVLEPSLSYLGEGDVVRITPGQKSIRTLYRKQSPHNFMLITERCNNLCLMCSQPPKAADDSFLVDEILRTIPLMSPETRCIGITGGEPSLLGPRLVDVIRCLNNYLPDTAVHILSNGRAFKNWDFAKSIAAVHHKDLMIGIPVYSDISSIHDYVVQAKGAFDETLRGIINLKSVGVRVEIRVVIHKQTYERLPELARFLRRNLTFCDQVVLMGLEMTGFTRFNLEKLWVDPKDYQPQLKDAVQILSQARMPVSIYNHQLCILDPVLVPFSRRSISDWKNEYMPECEGCVRRNECGGFFSSAKLRYSAHIKPFRN